MADGIASGKIAGGSVGVMKDGKIAQDGSPRELYESPASEFIADFIGEACAYDACDALLSLHCRAAAQTLWMQQALQRHANPQRIAQMKDHLLALTERPQHSLAHWPHEPHCTH